MSEKGLAARDDDSDAVEREPGTIVVLNRDLMFGMRVRNAARSLGFEAVFAAETAGFAEAVRARRPLLGVIDMNGAVDWAVVRALRDDDAVRTPLLAFGPHVDVAGRRAAKGAGVDRLVSNGEFHRDTVGLLRRYAAPV